MLSTQGPNTCKITLIGHHDTGLSLNGLNHKSSNRWILKLLFQCLEVIIRNEFIAGHIRPESLVRHWIIRATDRRQRTPPKITLCKDNLSLIFGNAFVLISPFSRQLIGGLSSFYTCIHRQNFVVAK